MGRVAKLGMRTCLSKTYADDDSTSSGGERELCESSGADPKIGGGRSAVVLVVPAADTGSTSTTRYR